MRYVAGDGNDVATVVFTLPIIRKFPDGIVNLHRCSLETVRVKSLETENELGDFIG